jgi:hypothetical protein
MPAKEVYHQDMDRKANRHYCVASIDLSEAAKCMHMIYHFPQGRSKEQSLISAVLSIPGGNNGAGPETESFPTPGDSMKALYEFRTRGEKSMNPALKPRKGEPYFWSSFLGGFMVDGKWQKRNNLGDWNRTKFS